MKRSLKEKVDVIHQ